MIKIKEVATLAHISVRTLHYYDQIDLFKPNKIDLNGYRLYKKESLTILQQILFLKELDFPLITIKTIINSPGFNSLDELSKQKVLLNKKRDRLDKILNSLDQTISSIQNGSTMKIKTMFNSFNMKDINEAESKYKTEVKEKYGDSDNYKDSIRRTSTYKEDDWKKITSESDKIMMTLYSLIDRESSDSSVQLVIRDWQNHISKYYYNCTNEILLELGKSYVADSRFTKNIDKFGEGLTLFFRDAITYYCKNSIS